MANTLLITKETGDYFGFTLTLNSVVQNKVINMRNDVLAVGNVCNFKTANGANIIKSQNISIFDITLVASGTFTFTNVNVFLNKLIDVGFYDWLLTSGGGGATRFDALIDTFDYFGKDGQAVRVNESQLKLETFTVYNYRKLTDLEDTFNTLIPNKMLVVDPLGTSVILKDQPAEPEQFLNAIGYFDYADLETTATPLSFVANVPKKLTNDTLGINTDTSQAPFGVSTIWNNITNSFDFSQLQRGDTIDIRIEANVTTTVSNQVVKGFLKIAEGSSSEYVLGVFGQQIKTAASNTQTILTQIYIRNENTITFPTNVYLLSENGGTVTVKGWYCRIIRKNINIVDINVNVLSSEIVHNETFGLQGGVIGDRQHVTTAEKTIWNAKENTSNKQNSLTIDGGGSKFPTVDAVNSELDNIKSQINPNTYVVTDNGYTFLSGTYTLNANWQWKINGVDKTNASSVIIAIPLASTGYSRIDLIVLNASNTAVRVVGTQSNTNPSSPSVPVGTILISFVLSDESTQTPSGPKPKNQVSQFLRNGETGFAPSEDVVFDSLAGKFNTPSGLTTNYLTKWNGSSLVNDTWQIVSGRLTDGADDGISNFQTTIAKLRGYLTGQILFDTNGANSSNIIKTKNNFEMSLYCGRGSTSEVFIGDTSFRVEVGASERMRIGTNGNLLVNTTTDNGVDKLQVNGTISASPATLSNQVVVKSQLDLKAPLASPTFTGSVIVPNANLSTEAVNKGQLDAFVPSGMVDLISAQTISGLKTFLSGMFGLRNVANTFTSFLTNTNTASRTYTLQDKSGTVAHLDDIKANPISYINIATSTYTLVLSDAYSVITFDFNGSRIITVPTNSTTPYALGTVISIVSNTSLQPFTINGTGVTFIAPNGLVTDSKSTFTLTKVGTDIWNVESDVSGFTRTSTNNLSTTSAINAGALSTTGQVNAGSIGIYSGGTYVQSAGNIKIPVINISTATNLNFAYSNANSFVYNCAGGTFTTTLQNASGGANIGLTFIIKNSGSGIITVATTLGQTIDGAASYVLDSQYDFIEVVSDGVNWVIVSRSVKSPVQLKDHYTDSNNVGTSETDLYTYTTLANRLNVTGEKIVANYGGTLNDVTASSQLKSYFGGTLIADTGALTMSVVGAWVINVSIIRTGATTARAIVNVSTPGASTASYTKYTSLTGLTFTNTNIIKITGQAGGATGGNDDITATYGNVEWKPAGL